MPHPSKKPRPEKNPHAPLVYLGRYVMFDTPVTLFINPRGSGGSVEFGWEPTAYVRIVVGIYEQTWSQVLDTLLHEALEFGFRQNGCHYSPSDTLVRDDLDRFFIAARHAEFSRICRHVADFLACCIPEVSTAYRRFRTRGTGSDSGT